MNNEMDFFVDKSLNLLDVENSTSRTNQDDMKINTWEAVTRSTMMIMTY